MCYQGGPLFFTLAFSHSWLFVFFFQSITPASQELPVSYYFPPYLSNTWYITTSASAYPSIKIPFYFILGASVNNSTATCAGDLCASLATHDGVLISKWVVRDPAPKPYYRLLVLLVPMGVVGFSRMQTLRWRSICSRLTGWVLL